MKNNIGEGIYSNEETLLLTENEYKKAEWIEEDEFIYNGVLYDLINKTVTGKNIVLKVIADIEEGNILKSLFDNTVMHLPIHKIMIQLLELLTIYNYTAITNFQFIKPDVSEENISVFKLIIPTPHFNFLFRPPKSC